MTKSKVFLTGGDNFGWALDEDLDLVRQSLKNIVTFSDLAESDVVHSMWWEGLKNIPEDQLRGKRVICHMAGEPFRYLKVPDFRHIASMVSLWAARTHEAIHQLASIGIESVLIPYMVNLQVFKPLQFTGEQVAKIRSDWKLPADKYILSSFHRDTEGSDLRKPKLVKGPDVFLEIVSELHKRNLPVHVLLAGPRRHWLRQQLSTRFIQYTFIGESVDGDDIKINMLSRGELNILYNISDLYMVSSRSEGGPHSLLEAGAARCKVVSTPVGLSHDILEKASIFDNPSEAVSIIEQDILTGKLSSTVDSIHEKVVKYHTPEKVTNRLQEIYSRQGDMKVFLGVMKPTRPSPSLNWSFLPFLRFIKEEALTVGIWHTFYKPPYGGGNQFMITLRKALLRRGIRVVENRLRKGIDVYLLNSIHFDVDRFLKFKKTQKVNVVHRIDGPIHLIRGFDREKDELCFDINKELASSTVLQSAWTYQRISDMAYQPVKPVLIHNAVDPDIFHNKKRVQFRTNRKIRLISSSWSANPRKGGRIYKWLDQNLDWNRYEYTFVGNVSERYENIRCIPPVPSEELAEILRQHDIYITASRNDPCSNALIEALACGLPALFFNDGGHPELVGYGGLPFNNTEDALSQLEKLVVDYDMYQHLIIVSSMDEVAEKYIAMLKDAARGD